MLRKFMIILGSLIVFILCASFLAIYLLSSGKPKPFYSTTNSNRKELPNSNSEKVFLEINGSRQGMFIKGVNADNPIILFLHGGMPVYFLTEKYPTQLEKNFVMVWWEQRGCGISNSSDTNPKDSFVVLEQLVDDAITLANYLRKRFGRDKIYLMGHSGGTFLGVEVIDKAPELFHAYIGIAQMSDQWKSEVIACKYMLEKYKEIGNSKMVSVFETILDSINNSAINSKFPEEYIRVRDVAMHELGVGTMRNMKNLVFDLIIPSLLFTEYTLSEKFNLWARKSKSGISQNWNKMVNTDLSKSKNKFKIPVYFFHGIHDYTCSYQLAKEYFDVIEAPAKGFYTFFESSHSPLLEEPTKTNNILINEIVKNF